VFLKEEKEKEGKGRAEAAAQRRYPKNASSNHFILKDEARPKIWQKESCVHTLKYARFSIDSVTRLFKTTRFFFIENSINSFSRKLMVLKLCTVGKKLEKKCNLSFFAPRFGLQLVFAFWHAKFLG